MLRVYGCIVDQHDIRLVLLAGVICCLSCWAALSLLARARRGDHSFNRARLAAAALVTGCGVWTTHFVAMLAFRPGIPVGYDLGLTSVSVAIAIVLSGLGYVILARVRHGAAIGGALIGVATAAMHFTGMAAVHVAAVPHWDPDYVAAAVILGTALASAALTLAERWRGRVGGRLAATGLLAAAICATHFTGMAAVSYVPDPTIDVGTIVESPQWLAVELAGIAALIVGLGLASTLIDRELAAQTARDAERLRASEARFRLLFESSPLPMCLWDLASWRLLEANDAMAATYGYARDEFLERTIRDLWLPEDVERLSAMALTPESSGKLHVTGLRHRTKDDRIIDVDVFSHRIEFNGIPARLSVISDVTARNAAEVQLRQTQKLEALGTLAGGVAHEINTPTQFVGDNLRFLETSFGDLAKVLDAGTRLCEAVERGEPDAGALAARLRETETAGDLEFLRDEIPTAISQALEGVARIREIVLAVKEFSHPDVKETAPTDLHHLIRTTITVARNQWKYAAELVTDFERDLPSVPCRPGEISQVILNLIVNAVHAVEAKAAGIGTILIATRRLDDTVEVRVTDSGTGIAPEIRDRIFDPFFTTKGAGKGTGQGLAICHSIVVQKHGGSIEVESPPGEGATFVVHLPLAVAPVDEMALQPAG